MSTLCRMRSAICSHTHVVSRRPTGCLGCQVPEMDQQDPEVNKAAGTYMLID